MKIKRPDGSFAQMMWAVFDNGEQVSHWDPRRDNTVAAFNRSQIGRDFRRGKIPRDSKRFTIESKWFVTPARERKKDVGDMTAEQKRRDLNETRRLAGLQPV